MINTQWDGLHSIEQMQNEMSKCYHPKAREAGAKGKEQDIVYTEIVKEVVDWESYIGDHFDFEHTSGLKHYIHHVCLTEDHHYHSRYDRNAVPFRLIFVHFP